MNRTTACRQAHPIIGGSLRTPTPPRSRPRSRISRAGDDGDGSAGRWPSPDSWPAPRVWPPGRGTSARAPADSSARSCMLPEHAQDMLATYGRSFLVGVALLAPRDAEPKRKAVLWGERDAVVVRREQGTRGGEVLQPQRGRVSVLGPRHHVGG